MDASTPRHLRDKYAIAGVGETTYTRGSGMSTRALGTWAVGNAIRDAGLTAADVDGMLSYQSGDSTFATFIAGDLGIPYKTLERWRQQLRKRGGAQPSLDDAQAHELARLRKRLADTEMERDILKKALAICSRETRGGGASS